MAIVSLTEMVVLKPALNSFGRWDAEDHRKRVEQLITRMKEYGQLRFRVSLGNYFTGPGSIARSYRTAKTTMVVGKQTTCMATTDRVGSIFSRCRSYGNFTSCQSQTFIRSFRSRLETVGRKERISRAKLLVSLFDKT